MKPIKYGTYGFLSVVLAAQLALATVVYADVQDEAERAKVDAKKSGRALKRDIKKGARKATGQDNAYDDVKDGAKDAGKNAQDELELQKNKLKK